MPRVGVPGMKVGVGRGADFRAGQHAFDQRFQPAAVVDPVVGLRPDAEFLDVVEVDGGRLALLRQAFEVSDHLVRRREGQAVAQGFRDREEVEPGAVFLSREIALQFVGALAGAEEVVVVNGHVADAGDGQRRDNRGFPDPLGQPGAGRADAGTRGQLVVQRCDWPMRSRMRDRGQHRLGIAGAEQLDLATADHFGQEFHVGRVAFAQPVEQPAGEVRGETEIRVGVQRFEEGLVATLLGVLDHFREIADRLVGMHTEEEGDGLGHRRLKRGKKKKRRKRKKERLALFLVWLLLVEGFGASYLNWRGASCRRFPVRRRRC